MRTRTASRPERPQFLRAVPRPYGGDLVIEAVDSAGGWLGSAVDLVRLMGGLDGSHGALLDAASLAEMTARPALSTWQTGNSWYGLGLVVVDSGGRYWLHDGSMYGMGATVAHAPDGRAVAIIVNTRAEDDVAFQDDLESMAWRLLDAPLDAAAPDRYPQFE